MEASDQSSFISRDEYILTAALLHTSPPGEQIRANCSRVLRHAMIAAGVWDDHYERGQSAAFHGEYDDFPLVRIWYESLVALTRCDPGDRLLEGAGNLEESAGAYFTACWLTPHGERAARQILSEHPELSVRLVEA